MYLICFSVFWTQLKKKKGEIGGWELGGSHPTLHAPTDHITKSFEAMLPPFSPAITSRSRDGKARLLSRAEPGAMVAACHPSGSGRSESAKPARRPSRVLRPGTGKWEKIDGPLFPAGPLASA